MNKTFLLLSLCALLTSTLAFAQDENDADQLNVVPPTVVKVTNDSSTEHAIWVTVYNSIGRISDVACVKPSRVVEFNGYMPPFSYEVRTEVKANMDCGGDTIEDMSITPQMSVIGIDVNVAKDAQGYFMVLK